MDSKNPSPVTGTAAELARVAIAEPPAQLDGAPVIEDEIDRAAAAFDDDVNALRARLALLEKENKDLKALSASVKMPDLETITPSLEDRATAEKNTRELQYLLESPVLESAFWAEGADTDLLYGELESETKIKVTTLRTSEQSAQIIRTEKASAFNAARRARDAIASVAASHERIARERNTKRKLEAVEGWRALSGQEAPVKRSRI